MFEGMLTSGAVVLLGCMDAVADSLPCQVDSSNDGNGLYAYTFHRDDAPYVWGWTWTTNGGIWMQFYGVREVQDPPGWSHRIDASGAVFWSPSQLPVYLDDPVTFSIRSCLAQTTTYTNWWPPGPYPVGTIVGGGSELPGQTNFLEGGYQNFGFAGPALPTLSIELQRTQNV